MAFRLSDYSCFSVRVYSLLGIPPTYPILPKNPGRILVYCSVFRAFAGNSSWAICMTWPNFAYTFIVVSKITQDSGCTPFYPGDLFYLFFSSAQYKLCIFWFSNLNWLLQKKICIQNILFSSTCQNFGSFSFVSFIHPCIHLLRSHWFFGWVSASNN